MFWAIYLIILFAGTAMMVREGLWSNAIALVNIIICGLVAFGFYQPVTIWIDEMLDGEYTYVLDFVVLSGVVGVGGQLQRANRRAGRPRSRGPSAPLPPPGLWSTTGC